MKKVDKPRRCGRPRPPLRRGRPGRLRQRRQGEAAGNRFSRKTDTKNPKSNMNCNYSGSYWPPPVAAAGGPVAPRLGARGPGEEDSGGGDETFLWLCQLFFNSKSRHTLAQETRRAGFIKYTPDHITRYVYHQLYNSQPIILLIFQFLATAASPRSSAWNPWKNSNKTTRALFRCCVRRFSTLIETHFLVLHTIWSISSFGVCVASIIFLRCHLWQGRYCSPTAQFSSRCLSRLWMQDIHENHGRFNKLNLTIARRATTLPAT